MPPRGQCARYKEYWDDDDEAYWQTESAEEEEVRGALRRLDA